MIADETLPSNIRHLLDPKNYSMPLGGWKSKKDEQCATLFNKIRSMLNDTKIPMKQVLVEVSYLVLLGIKCIALRDTKEILYFDEDQGIWVKGAEEIIAQLCHVVNPEFSAHQINEVIDKVRQCGYESAVTIIHGFNDESSDVYRLKRIGINDQFLLFKASVSGSYNMVRKIKAILV